MARQKSQFNILTLMLLTVIAALAVTLYLAHRNHREQVRVLEQKVNDLQFRIDVIGLVKSQLTEQQMQLESAKSHYGPDHPEVELYRAKLEMFKEKLIKSMMH